MDLLADILNQSGLKKRILNQRSFFTATSLKFPCDKSIGFHVITHGEAYIHMGDKLKLISLSKGDIALMSRGCDHVISTEEKFSAKVLSKAEWKPVLPFQDQSNQKAKLSLVSGAYQFWNTPVHPFFREMPDWFVIKSEDIENFDHLQTTIKLLSEEVAKPNLGSETIIQGLLDIIFSFIIRRIVTLNSSQAENWSHAVQDLKIRQALELLHADFARPWTLDELAREVGLSRAGFAQKFKKSLGDTPLHYLTAIRIQKAMNLLVNTEDSIEMVATAVGYNDAFSFSKVFKRVAGFPPRDFRYKDREDKNSKWRF